MATADSNDSDRQATNGESIDRVLNAVSQSGQLSGVRVLSETVLIELTEHVSQVC